MTETPGKPNGGRRLTGAQRLIAGCLLVVLVMVVLAWASHQLTSSVLVIAIPSFTALAGVLAGVTDRKGGGS